MTLTSLTPAFPESIVDYCSKLRIMLVLDCGLGNNSNCGGKLTVCVDLTITTTAGKICFRWFERRCEIRWACVNFSRDWEIVVKVLWIELLGRMLADCCVGRVGLAPSEG